MASHESYCNYPNDPCCCRVLVKRHRRTSHSRTCSYPKEPCSCKLEEAKKGERA